MAFIIYGAAARKPRERPWLLALTLASWGLLACLIAAQHRGVSTPRAAKCTLVALQSLGLAAAPAAVPQAASLATPVEGLEPGASTSPAPSRIVGGSAVYDASSSSSASSDVGSAGASTGSPLSWSWQEVDALIRQPTPRHGAQQKGGMPANWGHLLDHMTNRDAERHGVPANMSPAVYAWFARAHTFNKTAGQSNSALQSPVPACHFLMDHTYKLIFVRNTKTAGTSLARTLGIRDTPMMCRKSPSTCYARCQGKPMCLAYDTWEPARLKKAFAEYTVFTFVRNPWARAISSWLHIHNRGITKPQCQDSFAKFAELPSRYGARCLANPACCGQRFGWILEHVEPQSACLIDSNGQPSVDFIGRVEHAEEDLQALLELINRRRPNGTKALHVDALPHMMIGDAKLARAEDETLQRRAYAEMYLNNDALQDVLSYYHTDFDNFWFPRNISAALPTPPASRR